MSRKKNIQIVGEFLKNSEKYLKNTNTMGKNLCFAAEQLEGFTLVMNLMGETQRQRTEEESVSNFISEIHHNSLWLRQTNRTFCQMQWAETNDAHK